MTRKVFDNAMTAHVWAAQSQPEGRSNNGQFFFEGPTLFSYRRHYVAGFVLHMPGGPAFLTNADSYSITTTRHVSYAASAARYRALSVPGLTAWAELLRDVGTRYAWREAEEQEAAGTRPAWLPCGYVLKTAAERRKMLPRVRAMLKEAGDRSPGRQFRNQFDWPGKEAAELFLAYAGDRNAKAAAERAEAAYRGRERAAKARRDKEARDALARVARDVAAMSRGDVSRDIARRLGSYSHGATALAQLANHGRHVNRAAKEAKARGWTRVAASCRAAYKAIRAAIADGEARQNAAYRNGGLRRAIGRYRKAVELWTRDHDGGPAAGAGADMPGTWQRAQLLSRRAGEVAQAAEGLARGPRLQAAARARLATVAEAARAKAAELKEEAARLRYAEQEANIQAWRAGDMAGRFRFDCPRGGAALRAVNVERDAAGNVTGGTLQTSHGADVPLAHAIRAFRFLKHCRDTGTAWAANGRTLRVGHFRVDRVESSGDFRAGCHFITWQEVENLARSLGVLDLPPEDTTEDRHAAA